RQSLTPTLSFLHGSAPGLVCQYTDKNGMGKGVELQTMSSLVRNCAWHRGRVTTFHIMRDAVVSCHFHGQFAGWVLRDLRRAHDPFAQPILPKMQTARLCSDVLAEIFDRGLSSTLAVGNIQR